VVKSREPFKFWRAQPYPWNGWSSQALSTYFAGECHKLLTVGGNVDHIHSRDLYSAARPSRRNGFTTRRSYASAVLGVVILSAWPSVRLSVCHTRALWLIQRTYRRYFYTTWKAILLVRCDFSYSYAATDKISTDLRRRAVPAIAELLVLLTNMDKHAELWMSIVHNALHKSTLSVASCSGITSPGRKDGSRTDSNAQCGLLRGGRHNNDLLWSPYVIGQTIIFSSCFFLSSFFLLSFFFLYFFLA